MLNGDESQYTQYTWEQHAEKLSRGHYVEVPQSTTIVDVMDPWISFGDAPAYTFGQLPQVFEDYVKDCLGAWGGDAGSYACGFLAMHCATLDDTVVMQTNPLKPDEWRSPNDNALIFGKTGDNKSGLFRDMTKFQDKWQQAITLAAIGDGVSKKARKAYRAVFLQGGSIEGLLDQIEDNQGARMMVASDEIMMFYNGAAAHHRENGPSLFSDTVCVMYDGKSYTKRIRTKQYAIPKALGTVFGCTTADKISQWKSLPHMIESGMLARHTLGVIARPQKRDESQMIEGAEAAMGERLLKLRALKNVRFVLADDAVRRWLTYTEQRTEENNALEVGKIEPGLLAWIRKYDMRIMSLATIFQAYDFIAGGEVACEESALPTAGKNDDARILRTVRISRENMGRAVALVEGFLYEMQEYSYKVIKGQNEFEMELQHFVAKVVTTDLREISRNELTYAGPLCCRGARTDALLETHRRWCRVLIDYGIIEPDLRNMRAYKNPRDADGASRYLIRPEVFEFFAPRREQLQGLHVGLMAKLDAAFRRKPIEF